MASDRLRDKASIHLAAGVSISKITIKKSEKFCCGLVTRAGISKITQEQLTILEVFGKPCNEMTCQGPHLDRPILVSQSRLMYSVFTTLTLGLGPSQGLSERQAILLRLDDFAVATAWNFQGKYWKYLRECNIQNFRPRGLGFVGCLFFLCLDRGRVEASSSWDCCKKGQSIKTLSVTQNCYLR